VITNGAVSGTYSVAADGALTMTPASGSPLSGGISADGKTLVLSQLTAGQPSAFAVGIKQGQTNFTTPTSSVLTIPSLTGRFQLNLRP